MPYTVEQLPGKPAVLVTLSGEFDWNAEHTAVNADVATILDTIDQPGTLYRITDFTGITLNFAGVVHGLAAETSGAAGSISDPRLSQIYVGGDELVEFAAESVNQTQYGKLQVLHFETLDEAMVFLNALYS